jgi:ubiquinone/menaquinone biosynthesis C-methylase UbiE
MSLTKFIKAILKGYEAIPAPGAIVYNATAAKVLRKPETKIANDVIEKMGSGTIVDLGSGPGYLSIEIAKRTPGIQVYGIDLSRQMVRIARRHARGIENAQFKFGNAADLPFEDNSIDLIISTGSLHHWKMPVRVFDECYRVLKTGKEAWIYDGCPDAFKDQADKNRIRKEYGFLAYRIGTKVAELHGFAREEYETTIKDILDQTEFKGSHQMELTDVWMKITLKKHK